MEIKEYIDHRIIVRIDCVNELKQAWDKGVFNKSLLFFNVIIIVIVIIAC